MMDRRQLLQRASMLLGGAISTSAMAGVLAGCVASPDPGSGLPKGGFLTSEEIAAISAMAAQIIPRTDTPGAVEAGVPAFIDRMLTSFYQDRERYSVRAGLVRASSDAQSAGAASFVALNSDQQVALMRRYDQEQYDQSRSGAAAPGTPPHFFRLLKELTIIGFCTSEAGATSTMNYSQTPGPYRGDVPMSEIGKASAL